MTGVLDVSQAIDETGSGALAARGINPIRSFPSKGVLLWGARTTSQDSEYRYLAIRRLAIFLERSIGAGLQWTVFETNGPALWAQIRSSVSDFLLSIWHGGKLLGRTADEAFFVRCDETTMTQDDIDNGRHCSGGLRAGAASGVRDFANRRVGEEAIESSPAISRICFA